MHIVHYVIQIWELKLASIKLWFMLMEKGIRQISDFSRIKNNFHVRKSKIKILCSKAGVALIKWLSQKLYGSWKTSMQLQLQQLWRLARLILMFPCSYTRNFSLGRDNWDFVCDIRWFGIICSRIAVSHCEEKWQLIYTTVWWNGHCTKPHTAGLAATMDEVTNSFLVEVWMRTI